jgi:hypothetical protein
MSEPSHVDVELSASTSGASWRSGYAEDCKSLYGGSIPSEASSLRLDGRRPESFAFTRVLPTPKRRPLRLKAQEFFLEAPVFFLEANLTDRTVSFDRRAF